MAAPEISTHEAPYRPWAKHDPELGMHPLVYHMIDSASVAGALLMSKAGSGLNRTFDKSLRGGEQNTQALVSLITGLHDIGKASWQFQRQVETYRTQLEAMGHKPGLDLGNIRHDLLSAVFIQEYLGNERGGLCIPVSLHEAIYKVVGGHHGLYPQNLELVRARNTVYTLEQGNTFWRTMRAQLVKSLQDLYGPREAMFDNTETISPEEANRFSVLLSGIITFSDWLASNQDYFPYENKVMPLEIYARESCGRARRIIAALGWDSGEAGQPERRFNGVFGFKPRPLQRCIEDMSGCAPMLTIIEAPMGEGKTEAALYLEHAMRAGGHKTGLYYALPTMATSNQMFTRVKDYLARLHPETRVSIQLLHSHAALTDSFAKIRVSGIEVDSNGNGAVIAHDWFTQRKRGLLAPFSVGTVDQALMAALQLRHGYLRLFGLYGKTLVFDEVHAYDTYMLALFVRLLSWLRLLNCSVVIMSATLPEAVREEMLNLYARRDTARATAQYPRITSVDAEGTVTLRSFKAFEEKAIHVYHHAPQPAGIAKTVGKLLAGGGHAAIICNTVKNACVMYTELQNAFRDEHIHLLLFHARFPFARRQELEAEVMRQYSAKERVTSKSVCVATQVIEQSLDLDFDVMFSELAPADLILQRTGRLHRHTRERPERLQEPAIYLLDACDAAREIPDLPVIYDDFITMKSWIALGNRDTIHLPVDAAALVEEVYDDAVPDGLPVQLRAFLQESKTKLEEKKNNLRREAQLHALPLPDVGLIVRAFNQNLAEDNPEAHRSVRALTRAVEIDTIPVVCLHRTASGISLDPEGKEAVTTKEVPDSAQTRLLLGAALSLANWDNLNAATETEAPAAWRKNALLRYHRCLYFENMRCVVGNAAYCYDEHLGIIRTREEETP